MIARMESKRTHSTLKDIIGIVGFVVLVILGVIFINAFIFRTFNVEGPSMERTLYTGDKLIVNKLPVTIAHMQGKVYQPSRGQVIVFKNPQFQMMGRDEFIVKRVVGLPGERVRVIKGNVTVYNQKHPHGFNPDALTKDKEGSPTSGDVDRTVPDNELFVMGDHRQGNFSFDSRNGLSTIPLEDVVGPVGLRLFPFQHIRAF